MGIFDFVGDAWRNITGRTEAEQREKEADRLDREAQEAKDLAKRLQEDLNKTKDEIITDFDLSESVAKKLITEGEADQIRELNKTEEGAYRSIDELLQKITDMSQKGEVDELQILVDSGKLSLDALEQGKVNASGELAQSKEDILANLESKGLLSREDIIQGRELAVDALENEQSKIIEDSITSGFVSKEELDKGFLDSMKYLFSFNEKAIEALQPYNEAGQRALAQQKIYQGLATSDEITDFTDKYGDPNTVKTSPLYQLRLKEQEEAITRAQKARGNFLSGAGQRELLEEGVQQLSAEEADRRYREVSALGAQGYTAASNIAGIEERTGLGAAELSTGLGREKSGVTKEGMKERSDTRRSTALGKADIYTRSSESLAKGGIDLARMNQITMNEYGLSMADLESRFGNQKAEMIANQALNRNMVSRYHLGTRTQALSQSGANKTNIGLAMGQARQGIMGSTTGTLANLTTGMAGQRGNVRLGVGGQMGNIALGGQQLALGAISKASQYRTEASAISGQVYRGALSGLASVYGQKKVEA